MEQIKFNKETGGASVTVGDNSPIYFTGSAIIEPSGTGYSMMVTSAGRSHTFVIAEYDVVVNDEGFEGTTAELAAVLASDVFISSDGGGTGIDFGALSTYASNAEAYAALGAGKPFWITSGFDGAETFSRTVQPN